MDLKACLSSPTLTNFLYQVIIIYPDLVMAQHDNDEIHWHLSLFLKWASKLDVYSWPSFKMQCPFQVSPMFMLTLRICNQGIKCFLFPMFNCEELSYLMEYILSISLSFSMISLYSLHPERVFKIPMLHFLDAAHQEDLLELLSICQK